MIKRNINIPATLVRTVNGRQYQMQGTLLSINESNDTCSMKLKGVVKRNIPLDSVLINENFIDKIKEFGQKAFNYVRKKIKGFFVLVDEATKQIMPGSERNVANLAICSANGTFQHALLSPSQSVCDETGITGLSVDDIFRPGINYEITNVINPFWTRFIKRAGTTDETLEESVQYVKKHFYKWSKESQALNETAIYTIGTTAGKDDDGDPYGKTMNAKELMHALKLNIKKQLRSGIGKQTKAVPLLIWGSPGIGKTAIVHSLADEFRRSPKYNYNLHIQTIQCGGLTIENWTLTSDNSAEFDGISIKRFTDTAKTWLPVYENVPDREKLEKLDKFFNDCSFLGEGKKAMVASEDGKPFNGGIVFFDEIARTYPNVHKLIFNIAENRSFGDNYIVASGWGFVYAANRAIDDNEADSDDPVFFPPPAQSNRYTSVLYVPEKKEWLEWASKINKKTGFSNIEPFIIQFIKECPEHVWYSTITNGGYDWLLKNPKEDKLAHEDPNDPDSTIQSVLDQPKIKKNRLMITPRTWQKISDSYREELYDLFSDNKKGMDPDDYIQMLVDKSKIRVDASNEDVPDGFEVGETSEYYGGIRKDVLINALNNDIPKASWDEWVEDAGGEETLNPDKQRGRFARYNMLMNWFIDNAIFLMGDPSKNHFVSHSEFMKQWNAYNEYESVFTEDVIDSIWNTGKMPGDTLQSDDDIVPASSNFSNTQFSKWKQNPAIHLQVFDKIFASYPGNMDEQLSKDIQNLGKDNFAGASDKEIIEEGRKYQRMYSFKLNDETVSNMLILNNDFNDITLLKTKLNTLKNSKLSRQFCFFMLWAAKISLQTGTGNSASYVHDLLKSYEDKSEADYEDIKKFYDKSAIAKLNTQNTKQQSSDSKQLLNLSLASAPGALPTIIYQSSVSKNINDAKSAKNS